jgi:hypothetical protein
MRVSFSIYFSVAAFAVAAGSWPTRADAQGTPDISIVTALYGPASAPRPRDFTVRLQQTCGDRATTCESFCSSALIGRPKPEVHLPFSPRPICRVVYRCGDDVTRAIEADDNDTLVLSCRQPR